MLTFGGIITDGRGRHSDMGIPGRLDLDDAPDDWPTKLCPGSLNILIEDYPNGFLPPIGNNINGVYQLDDGSLQPTFVIDGNSISNNELIVDGIPSSAQVWRAQLQVEGQTEPISCWVLRRFGSNVGKNVVGDVLEIVANANLRDTYELKDGQKVNLTLMEGESS